MTYQSASDMLQGRNKDSKRLGHNTYLVRRPDCLAVMYHKTDVISLYQNKTYKLDSGGWITKTTKERLNDYSPANISQKAGIWYMQDGSLFYDGIIIDETGKALKPKQPKKLESQNKQAKFKAKLYAKAFSAAVKAGNVPYPSGGDCWYCAMFDKNGETDNEHIKNHIIEQYFVPSLLVNAAHDSGYSNMQIGLMGIGGQSVIIDPEQVIYKYVYKRLMNRRTSNKTLARAGY